MIAPRRHLLCLALVVITCPAGAGEPSIQITASDLVALADAGVIGSHAEAHKVWAALRALHQRKIAERATDGHDEDVSSVVGAVQDLQRLLSMTNLLYCIASTLLAAVFTFLLYTFRETHTVQGPIAFGYAGGFVYFGLKLLAIDSVSGAVSPGASGSKLIGGMLLMVPNIAAVAVGAAAIEVMTGQTISQLADSWKRLESLKALLLERNLCLSAICVASCIMLYSGALFSVSHFPMLLFPLFGSLYILIVAVCLLLSQQLTAAVWASIGHSLVLWCCAHSGIGVSELRLGMMISACNSAFWSFPYMLCAIPAGVGTDAGWSQFQSVGATWTARKGATTDFNDFIEELWGKRSFVGSLLCYALGNIGVLFYGFKIKSWVLMPYALIGVIVTMLLANRAPPRMRMVWRLCYNLPMSLLLFACSSAYEHITDTLWLEMLAWLGHPQHFRVVAIFFIRGAAVISAMWSLWYGLSRLFPSRILQDLEDQKRAIEVKSARLSAVREMLQKKDGTATQESSGGGWFFSRSTDSTQSAKSPDAGSRQKLTDELTQLESTEEARRRQKEKIEYWSEFLNRSGRVALLSIPFCWAGYSISAAVCATPEPFPNWQFAVNINAAWYIVRAFGGLVYTAVSDQWRPWLDRSFAEWRALVPLETAVPLLFVFGARVVAMADDSIFRNLAGLILLGSGFAGLLRSLDAVRATLIGASVSVALMAFGLLFDVNVLVFAGVLCLYSLGIYLLCATLGQNTVTIVSGITAVAVGTMHLGMSYEAYFLALHNVAGIAMPFSASLHALVAKGGLEMQFSAGLLRIFGMPFRS